MCHFNFPHLNANSYLFASHRTYTNGFLFIRNHLALCSLIWIPGSHLWNSESGNSPFYLCQIFLILLKSKLCSLQCLREFTFWFISTSHLLNCLSQFKCLWYFSLFYLPLLALNYIKLSSASGICACYCLDVDGSCWVLM